jgi:transcriptional regulator GlxA family with amidase domain
MEKDEINNQDKLSTIQDSQHTTSVRKLYLNKRASVLRESFVQNRHDIEHFVHDVESSSFNATKDELFFASSLSWMQSNLHNEASIAELGKFLGVSVRKVQRLFSFFLDRTYTNVLLDMRIEAAKGYLSQHKNSVGEVAYLIGVKDHAYFTYLFRKATGMTPSEYRLSLIQSHV